MNKTQRLDNLIAFGEIEQTRRNCVMANLWVRGDQDIVITLELAGNLEGIAANRTFRFRANELLWAEEPDLEDCSLQLYQQGVVGRCVIEATPQDPEDLGSSADDSHRAYQPMNLTLEWWAQDGHVILQLESACIEFEGEYRELEDLIDCDEEPPEPFDCEMDENGVPAWLRDLPEDATSNDAVIGHDEELDVHNILPIEQMKAEEAEMSWEELEHNNSPETQALYHEWDEILHGKNHEPFDWLIDDSVRLPLPQQIRDEAEAVEVLRKLLSRLAPLGIVLDMCEHISAFEAYQMMINEFLPGTQIHPRMGAAGFVHHFSTWEYCEQCNEEMDEEMGEETEPDTTPLK